MPFIVFFVLLVASAVISAHLSLLIEIISYLFIITKTVTLEEFCVKGVFKSSAKFTRKQLFCKLSFLIKLQTYCRNRYFPMNFAILLSIPKVLKTSFFIQNLQTVASVCSLYNFYVLLPYTAKNTVISPNFLVWNALYFLVCTVSA